MLEKNNEQIAKGLKPLIFRKKPETPENIIIGQTNIKEYIPDDNNNNNISNKKLIEPHLLCQSITMFGKNKGKQCSIKHIENELYCFRHMVKK